MYVVGSKPVPLLRAIKQRPDTAYYFFNISTVAIAEMFSLIGVEKLLENECDRLRSSRAPYVMKSIILTTFDLLNIIRRVFALSVGLFPLLSVGYLSFFWIICKCVQHPEVEAIKRERQKYINNLLINMVRSYHPLHDIKFKLRLNNHLTRIFSETRFYLPEEVDIYKIIPKKKLIATVLNTIKNDPDPAKRQTCLHMGPDFYQLSEAFPAYVEAQYSKHRGHFTGKIPQSFNVVFDKASNEHNDLTARYFDFIDRKFLELSWLKKKCMKNTWDCLNRYWLEENYKGLVVLGQEEILDIFQDELNTVLDGLYLKLAKSRRKSYKLAHKTVPSAKSSAVEDLPDDKQEEPVFYPDTMSEPVISAYVKYHLAVSREEPEKPGRIRKLGRSVSQLIRLTPPAPKDPPVLTEEYSQQLLEMLGTQRELHNRMYLVKHCMDKLIACDGWQSSRIGRGILPLTLQVKEGGETLPVYHISCGKKGQPQKTATLVFANINNNFTLLAVAEHTGLSGATTYKCLWRDPEWDIGTIISYSQTAVFKKKTAVQPKSYQNITQF